MATFQFFNIKLLPHDSEKGELVGMAGYKKLFQKLKEHTELSHRAKNILGISYSLRNSFYLSILHIHIKDEFSIGKFIKFDKPENLVNTLTGDPIQSVPEDASAHRYEFEYFFDYSRHVAAIQQITGKSPHPSVIAKALTEIIEPVATSAFPDYYLKVDILTSDLELTTMLKNAERFKRAEVHISVTNSDDYLEDEVKETEREMKELGVSEIDHAESAPRNGFMKALSKKCIAYLKIARKNGNATVRYLDKQTGKIQKYVMKDHPFRLTVTKSVKKTEPEYQTEVLNAIAKADLQTRR